MLENIKEETKYLLQEWYRYMDTTIPSGVNRQLFTHLKYSNKNRIKQIQRQYPEIDISLLEKHALWEYLQKSDEQIRKDLQLYKEVEGV